MDFANGMQLAVAGPCVRIRLCFRTYSRLLPVTEINSQFQTHSNVEIQLHIHTRDKRPLAQD